MIIRWAPLGGVHGKPVSTMLGGWCVRVRACLMGPSFVRKGDRKMYCMVKKLLS